jgi:hypothetical protein
MLILQLRAGSSRMPGERGEAQSPILASKENPPFEDRWIEVERNSGAWIMRIRLFDAPDVKRFGVEPENSNEIGPWPRSDGRSGWLGWSNWRCCLKCLRGWGRGAEDELLPPAVGEREGTAAVWEAWKVT